MSNKPVPATKASKQLILLAGITNPLRLVWRLFRDNSVSLCAKSVLSFSFFYLFLPFDFLSDVILGFGKLDDIGVILLGMALFVKLSPSEVVEQHLMALEYGKDFYDDDETVDTTYRVVGED